MWNGGEMGNIFKGHVMNELGSFKIFGRDAVSLTVLKLKLISPT
jgi:hypothetical protein